MDGSAARIAGVVLAGGKSSRFGSNKALALLEGVALVERVVALLQAQVPKVLLVTNAPELHRSLGLPMTGDIYRDSGPLAGIHAAFKATEEDWLLVAACDMPLITDFFLRHLLRCVTAKSGKADAIVPWTAAGAEPLCSLYHRRILPLVEEMLAAGRFRLGELLAKIDVRRVGAEEIQTLGSAASLFHNVNRPADIDQALRYLHGEDSGRS